MKNDIERVLFTEAELKARVAEIARQIEQDYEGKEIMLISVLRGSFIFMADLCRASENLARRCDGDGVPTVGELRGHEAEALGNLARVIVLSAW